MNWLQRLNPFNQIQLQQPAIEERTIVLQSVAAGSSGIEIQDGLFQEEYLRELTNTERADLFDKMRRSDARIKMCISAVKNPIRSASWEWQATDDSEEAKRQAALLDEIFFKQMNRTWKQFLNEALSCIEFGHAIFEKTHKVVENHPEFGTFNAIACMGWRSPRTIERFNVDGKTGALTGVEQLAFGDLERSVTMDAKFLNVITVDQEGDNYEGIALLRPCFGSYKRKLLYLKLMAIGIEKHAIPTPWIKVPEGKENSAQFTAMIETMRKYMSHESNFLTSPAGWDIDQVKNDFNPDKVKTAIDFENQEMTFAFLANFLELGMNSVGSYALSNDLSDFFLGGLEYIADLISEEMNKVGKEITIMNFGEQPSYPELMHSGITDKAGEEFGKMMKLFVDADLITPDERLETNLRKRLGLPEADESTRRKKEPMKAPGGDPGMGGGLPTLPPQPPEPSPDGGPDPDPDNAPDEVDDDDLQLSEDEMTDEELLAASEDELSEVQKKRLAKLKKAKDRLYVEPRKLTLAETAPRRQITKTSEVMLDIMTENTQIMGDDLVAQVMRRYDSLPDSRKQDAITSVGIRKTAAYKTQLREAMIFSAFQAIEQARKEVPGADPNFADGTKHIKLQTREEFAKMFKDLPPDVRKRIQLNSQLIVQSQGADLEKAVFFQFGDSVISTGDRDVIQKDLSDKVDRYVEGPAVSTAAVNTASRMINDSRQAFFFDDEVLEEVDTFTFQNAAPESDICRSLTGKTFAANDKEAQRLFPPLHHNCKSFITPNLKGAKNNPELTAGGLRPTGRDANGEVVRDDSGKPVTVEKALKSATFSEPKV